jgi:hypothetical protein
MLEQCNAWMGESDEFEHKNFQIAMQPVPVHLNSYFREYFFIPSRAYDVGLIWRGGDFSFLHKGSR